MNKKSHTVPIVISPEGQRIEERNSKNFLHTLWYCIRVLGLWAIQIVLATLFERPDLIRAVLKVSKREARSLSGCGGRSVPS